MDNLKVGEVEITAKPQKQHIANIENIPLEITVANENSTKETLKLMSYLKAVSTSKQVIFGQQNNLHNCVNQFAKNGSDVFDITGSFAGIMGIDTLSLTGIETDAKNQKEAMEKSISICKKAVSKGCIITLSTHMPCFLDDRFELNKGEFDFFTANFEDCKITNKNIISEILGNITYKNRLNAYLDIIAEFANKLKDTPILFRPYHENNGDWFWWGSNNDIELYKKLYIYTFEYLKAKNVNNFLYVYSPNGPFNNVTDYLERFPSDNCVDIIAFDYYDDYTKANSKYSEEFFEKLEKSCSVIKEIADTKGKIPAIAETGTRVKRENGNFEGIDISNNPILNKNWYIKVKDISSKYNVPYFMLWANFHKDNFYLPFKYTNSTGHELINEFIEFYNEKNTIFSSGTNFYI